jgi:hypothetical protein
MLLFCHSGLDPESSVLSDCYAIRIIRQLHGGLIIEFQGRDGRNLTADDACPPCYQFSGSVFMNVL